MSFSIFCKPRIPYAIDDDAHHHFTWFQSSDRFVRINKITVVSWLSLILQSETLLSCATLLILPDDNLRGDNHLSKLSKRDDEESD